MATKRTFIFKDRTFIAYCGFDGRYIADVSYWELRPNRKIFKYKYFGSKSFLLDTKDDYSITNMIETKLAELLYEKEEEEKLTKIRENFKKGIDK